jgi:hypothetical protein
LSFVPLRFSLESTKALPGTSGAVVRERDLLKEKKGNHHGILPDQN